MGFNEYAQDSMLYGEEAELDPMYEEESQDPLGPEDWQDWNSEHLLNMWMSLEEYRQSNYIKSELMQFATFNSFCEYAWRFSRH
jgi:hypothetical protein